MRPGQRDPGDPTKGSGGVRERAGNSREARVSHARSSLGHVRFHDFLLAPELNVPAWNTFRPSRPLRRERHQNLQAAGGWHRYPLRRPDTRRGWRDSSVAWQRRREGIGWVRTRDLLGATHFLCPRKWRALQAQTPQRRKWRRPEPSRFAADAPAQPRASAHGRLPLPPGPRGRPRPSRGRGAAGPELPVERLPEG